MLDHVLNIFDITPEYDLDIMKERQTLTGITTLALNGVYDVIQTCEPDVVLVHGDTTTTFAGALAAFYNQVKIGHVEAGLRTFNNYSPYPEEVNRRLTGVLANYNFAPTQTNKRNLLNENHDEKTIYITGNTVIDALSNTVKQDYKFENEILADIDLSKTTILVTAHRRENWGEPLENICYAIRRVAQDNPDVQFIYPVHLNPLVSGTAYKILGEIANVYLIEPIGVTDLHNVMARCRFVMTDSGGLQEEAPSLGKPVLVLRTETERPEALEAGTVQIVGVAEDSIVRSCETLLKDNVIYEKMAKAINPYGDGKASIRIAEALEYEFGLKEYKPMDFM
jgi:UDP-N-acetylglucosamine 2-epimerase (non-hydrolysing)